MNRDTENQIVRNAWVRVPDLDQKAQVSANRAQTRIMALLRERRAHLAFIKLDNLEEAPRRSHITYWILRNGSYQSLSHEENVQQNVIELDVGIDMVPIAIDLYRRWPAQERPMCITLVSDGTRLLFNPGRPEGNPTEILQAHKQGIAPAAILLMPRDNRSSHLSIVFGA